MLWVKQFEWEAHSNQRTTWKKYNRAVQRMHPIHSAIIRWWRCQTLSQKVKLQVRIKAPCRYSKFISERLHIETIRRNEWMISSCLCRRTNLLSFRKHAPVCWRDKEQQTLNYHILDLILFVKKTLSEFSDTKGKGNWVESCQCFTL